MAAILGIYASQISGHLWEPAGAYDALASVTLSSNQSTLSFSGIPSTYKHLQIRATFKLTGSDNLMGRFNSDTGSVYTTHYLYGQGSTVYPYASSSSNIMNMAYTSSSDDQVVWIADILDYASTSKYKTVRRLSGQDMNGSGFVWFGSHLYQSTSAISSIDFSINGPYLITSGSTFALYGVK